MASWYSAAFSRRARVSGPLGSGGEIEGLRQAYAQLAARFGPPPPDAVFEAAQLGPIKGEWVRVDASAPQRLILYFHGGGFVTGSPQTHRPLIARLCHASQASAFALSYRLAPEFAYPAGLRDAIDAYRQLLGRGIPAMSIVLAGDAAGGGLAFSTALAIRNAGLPMPAGIVAMSPWADLTLSGWSMLHNARADRMLNWEMLFRSARHYVQKGNPTEAYASPAFANFHDFPPIMVHAGSMELLRDDASRLGDRAAEANVPVNVEIYDGMPHLFQADVHLQESRVSLMRLGQFIKSRAKSARAAAAEIAAGGE